jgi:hypothetical protein
MTPDIHVPTPFVPLPVEARRGNRLIYNELAPLIYEVERGLGGEYMKTLRKR